MKSKEDIHSAQQQESNEISYANKLFPHISTPSKRIEDLSKCLWELFFFGSFSQKNCNLIQFLLDVPDFNSMSSREKAMIIQAYKNKVAQINKYDIKDEELIITLLKHSSLRMTYFPNERDIIILAELVREPLLSNTELSKYTGLSRAYVSRRRTMLTNDGIILNKLFVDPHYFGLAHYLFLFVVSSKFQQHFEELFVKNPYLMSVKKTTISPIKEQTLYLISFYVPHTQRKKFFAWLNQQKHYGLVIDYSLFEVCGLGHSVNLRQLERGKWNFDVSRDIILSFKFTREQYHVLPINKYFRKYIYQNQIRNTFTYEELLVASLLSEKPHLSLSDLERHLRAYDISISKTTLSKIRNNLSDALYPYIHLDNIGLGSTLIVFIWEPFLSNEESEFLTKYFANNFPQTTFMFGKDGFFAAMEIPFYGARAESSLLAVLHKYYTDAMVFLSFDKFWDKPIGTLFHYWDRKKRTWRIEDWMLPDIKDTIS